MNFEPLNIELYDDTFYNAGAGAGSYVQSGLGLVGEIAKAAKPPELHQQVKDVCGNKPFLPGKKKQAWKECQDDFLRQQAEEINAASAKARQQSEAEKRKEIILQIARQQAVLKKELNNKILIVVLSVVGVGVLSFIGYKLYKANQAKNIK